MSSALGQCHGVAPLVQPRERELELESVVPDSAVTDRPLMTPRRYGLRMARLWVSRETLARMLCEHGEDDLAERAPTLSDDELARIGTLGAYYAFSEDAMALGGSMGGSRALSLATIDVLEDTGRDLRLSRTGRERQGSSFDEFAEHDAARDRELQLRRQAAEQQIPADESKRTLDTVDPPAWGPAPPDATFLVTRCHELRTKPLRDLTAEDLQIMIGQQVALNHLVWPALDRLRSDSLVEIRRLPHRPSGQRASRGLCVLGTIARLRPRTRHTG